MKLMDKLVGQFFQLLRSQKYSSHLFGERSARVNRNSTSSSNRVVLIFQTTITVIEPVTRTVAHGFDVK